jgi:hypothetical protein
MFDGLIELEGDFDVAEVQRGVPPALEVAFDDESTVLTIESASTQQLLSAQASTASWLDEIGAYTGDPEADLKLSEEQRAAARDAFSAVTNPYADPLTQKSRLMVLSAPVAVRHLAGMLSQYDWEFVKQAKEIRGYIVARLVEHSKSPDAKISLQALRTLGTVTEIGAYTDRIEISRPPAEATPSALADAIRQKLREFLPRTRVDPPEDTPFVERVAPVNERSE